eukprot:CAMPEP_0117546036 /NCGR_PEP_ID=MMETSP0784-20121206/46402_1 /TAXON_ID=39447 /ORGANISM="" /LENGTH=192 /DNA_ID=CAMNT_0005342899 /DNA_START=51 /DNA_END=629 /DNA_ORIENTATION=-
MRTGFNIPTDVDRKCYASLHHVLRPEYHGLVDDWMKTAGEREKKGMIKLAQFAEPVLNSTVGRPQPGQPQMTMTSHPWHHRKSLMIGPDNPSGWPVRDSDGMLRSASMPSMLQGQKQEAPMHLSWMVEDGAEVAQIDKPGGYVVKLKDGTAIQRMKNAQRNKGTYKLFGGTFDGSTSQGAAHNLRSIGLEPV